jgi:hypothetical protein
MVSLSGKNNQYFFFYTDVEEEFYFFFIRISVVLDTLLSHLSFQHVSIVSCWVHPGSPCCPLTLLVYLYYLCVSLKSCVDNILTKTTGLRITLNLDGTPITSRTHTHVSYSQSSRLLTSSLSLGVPVPRAT